MLRSVLVVFLLLAQFSSARGADVMRCGASLIDVGMVATEVVAKCGEPKSKEIEDVEVRARTGSGGSAVIGTVRVERWVYDRGYGRFPARLTFEDGYLKKLEFLDRS